ncbi:Molybdopterin biosynthesis MoaE [Glomus cerebriforme]|uniref:Molybdopterin synthase catalytic subunit n=1 Tax=Glomus cerebriforme TaxID=658196 RepID=A0A397SW33_9GLOM|nr:Molybdopterin biosynthesis MoaE [Glomus cerebriforme]RIA97379.1 Molybdopterin biosynthesis MoaE [Glomus cerebriforme]
MTNLNKDFVKLTSENLILQDIINLVKDDGAGAITTFNGTTRNIFKDKIVVRLEYESYIPMAEKVLLNLICEARTKWDITKVAIYHRTGIVPVGETSVIVAVSSIHRKESLHAVEWLIDELKEKAPIWKKEVYSDGSVWKENAENRQKC